MKILSWLICTVVMITSIQSAEAYSKSKINKAKDAMIKESIRDYKANYGNCPCPYNKKSNGNKCGKTSAWYRDGGQSPLCYRDDISKREAIEYLND